MYLERVLPKTVEKRISSFLLIVGPLVTLAITPWFNYDPVNLGKGLALSTFALGGVGLVIPYWRTLIDRLGRAITLSAAAFVLSLFAPLIFTEAPKQQQIWGQFGRTTGIITYLSLLSVLLLGSLLRDIDHHKKMLYSLIITQTLMTVYCVLQATGNDPIVWSSYSTFGTLGNVNFLSGFMGISVVITLILAISSSLSNPLRAFLFFLSVADIVIVATTDSIQGLVALAVGFSIYLLFVSKRRGSWIFYLYTLLFVAAFTSLVFALFDKGPLRSFVYQVTIVFRADYMHAGWKMLLGHPFTGVGIDSYDDWYRTERGVISAFRTSFNRTANTAHNVMLDIGSGGGFPLLISYLAIIFCVLVAIVRGLRNGLYRDSFFLALVCSWLAYQVQASVSINQIGVGIWGWIIGGSIIGYQRNSNPNIDTRDSGSEKKHIAKEKGLRKANKAPNTPPPIAVVLSVIGLSIGFVVNVIPMKIDADFRAASSQGRLDRMIEITENANTNAFLLGRANELALTNKYQQQARLLNDRLVSRYPRYIYGWQARLNLTDISSTERISTIEKIRALDPYLAICAGANPSADIETLLLRLPPSQQFELAKGWGLISEVSPPETANFTLNNLESKGLKEKIDSFCMG